MRLSRAQRAPLHNTPLANSSPSRLGFSAQYAQPIVAMGSICLGAGRLTRAPAIAASTRIAVLPACSREAIAAIGTARASPPRASNSRGQFG
jgi:hypothetical protein